MTSPDPLPRRFGQYLLFDKIGEGGMARIYLARARTGLGGERLVVVKQILPLLSTSQQFSQLLTAEAKLAAGLSHGNIVQVIDLGREDDMLYIAMEYVEGFDLRELLTHCSKAKVPLPVEFSLLVVSETLRALEYAHKKRDSQGRPLQIVHRDVSPSNILMSFEGEVKLCDFGIARAIGTETEVDAETIQGKAGYMSPEAANGESLDARADVFSAAIVLWELVAGRRLYRSKSGNPSLRLAREAQIPALPERGYPLESRLHQIVMRGLAREREDRYPDALSMLNDLQQWIRDAGLHASSLKFGAWLMDHFGKQIVERRRMRQLAAKAIDGGPLVQFQTAAIRPETAELEGKERETGDAEVPAPQTPALGAVAAAVAPKDGVLREGGAAEGSTPKGGAAERNASAGSAADGTAADGTAADGGAAAGSATEAIKASDVAGDSPARETLTPESSESSPPAEQRIATISERRKRLYAKGETPARAYLIATMVVLLTLAFWLVR